MVITKRLRTWSGFIREIENLRAKYGVHRTTLPDGQVHEDKIRLLFRGQSNHKWSLQTTLERKTSATVHVSQYIQHAVTQVNEIESFTGAKWGIDDFPKLSQEITDNQSAFRVVLPVYDYLVYLRHHGFPSPLLDWTESPFIAAYFAYLDASKQQNPAVYCYIAAPEGRTVGLSGGAMVTVKGPYVTTHKRHFAQKALYTVSTKWDELQEKHYFCPHESVFERDDPGQDLLFKFVLPHSERIKALHHLNDYNINHFTLFQSEDSLIKALETRSFDIEGL